MAVYIPRVKLGSQGLEVSKLGLGCLGLTGIYNSPLSDEDGISVIKHAFNRGITFFDTANVYGLDCANEILLGKALKQLPRDKVQIATKFGVVISESFEMDVKGTPEYVRSCCEASLERLDVQYIDLYYQHRVDISIPIEDTMGELKKLVEEGKIKYIGLCEASAETIRRAHAIHHITAVQMEWSLWTREIEQEIVPVCMELGIGIVPNSPLGRGFFGGKAVEPTMPLPHNSFLNTHPRFQPSNLDKNSNLYMRIKSLAMNNHSCTPAQIALAWLLHQQPQQYGIVPIPGTTNMKNMDENIGSVRVKLDEDEVREISNAVPMEEVQGAINYNGMDHMTWKVANTPPNNLCYD